MIHLLVSKQLGFVAVAAILLAAFNTPEIPGKENKQVRWVVQKNSFLHIAGKTNLAPFGCVINGYHQYDTITYSQNEGSGKAIPLSGMLNLAINDFNCGNKGLTKDLRKILKADVNPSLIIRFIALERLPDLARREERIRGWIDVAMAGVTKRFEIVYSLEKQGDALHLDSRRTFQFSEFNLVPPQKLGGMIKVKNAFVVDFSLVLQQLL